MPSGKSLKKLRLFEQGVANLSNIVTCPANVYCCPLCGEFKSIDELTLEHVPPKSMGGKEIILTCAQCNNDAGISIDSHIAKQQNMHRLARSMATQTFTQKERATVDINGTRLRVELTKDDDDSTINIAILKQANSPQDIQSVQNFAREIASSDKGLTFALNSESRYHYNEKLVRVGHLKTAFLIATAAIVYSFAFSDSVSAFRRQIREPSESIVNYHLEYYSLEAEENSLAEAPELGVIVVSIFGVRVLLPHPQRSLSDYASTVRAVGNGLLATIKGTIIPWPDNFIGCLDNSDDIVFSIVET
ncbi:HNH endonuclease [Aliiglaciecola lipolytica]|uniref:HNH endonuclease 5 domain-containing protein n=1 Tax=Aliiglaciecola lipolytica E3 TaxID=1127673 RepID=K6X031_9ALTE|nr:HNH endonuclease [Aliiglaciecola lipolytica]GAC14029.1 hypothetical protein GLIP_1388 [Aliiglaciecola lipolytica E3]